MLCLGTYWSWWLYNDWQRNPVLTTVTTTALPVSQVPFPAVTICSEGKYSTHEIPFTFCSADNYWLHFSDKNQFQKVWPIRMKLSGTVKVGRFLNCALSWNVVCCWFSAVVWPPIKPFGSFSVKKYIWRLIKLLSSVLFDVKSYLLWHPATHWFLNRRIIFTHVSAWLGCLMQDIFPAIFLHQQFFLSILEWFKSNCA